MVAFKHLLSHARRHCTASSPSHFSFVLNRSFSYLRPSTGYLDFCKSPSTIYSSHSASRSLFPGIKRLFSSSETQNEDLDKIPPQPPLIKPVSYAIKPKEPLPEEEHDKFPAEEFRRPREPRRMGLPTSDFEQVAQEKFQTWTREDVRYMKDVPSISPISYPSREAPLPEDKVPSVPTEGDQKEDNATGNVLLEWDRRRTENNTRRRMLMVEDKVLPFPTLIKVEKNKQKVVLDLQEAIREVKANAKANFDETVEVHVRLGVDPRRGDQMVRGAATLPHGTGKTVRIAVFAEGAAAEEARAAGADIIGGEDLIEEIRKGGGKLNFDKCIATPIFMPRLGKIARILGPRVRDAKRGRVDFKIDKTAIVHAGLGKVSFTEETLRENVGAFVNALLLAKPVGLKKTSKYAGYVNSFSLCSTRGPGFRVSIQSLSLAADHYNKLKLK
ncbi:50S ribosomal protein L1 [Thalictrum thalictroides]|uniref:CL1 n=1 Tax=Thalictrum thalictroides TaxID=46969 RepID=A0A7J6VQI5_THATH|nr:50S ribosomal protein L1 [Thalictrum thalictroides]